MLTYKDLQKLYNIKTNKYGNKKVKDGNETFDSVFEYNRWCELKLLERGGVINNLRRQVKYELIPKSKWGRALYYIADFVYEENGVVVVEDTKGYLTDIFKLKARLFEERYNFSIKLVKNS